MMLCKKKEEQIFYLDLWRLKIDLKLMSQIEKLQWRKKRNFKKKENNIDNMYDIFLYPRSFKKMIWNQKKNVIKFYRFVKQKISKLKEF